MVDLHAVCIIRGIEYASNKYKYIIALGYMSALTECCVCFEDQRNRITARLPCRHEMCMSCMMSVIPSDCPLCRRGYADALEHFKDTMTRMNTRKDTGISYTQSEFPSLPGSR
jgi:hypothetical protein